MPVKEFDRVGEISLFEHETYDGKPPGLAALSYKEWLRHFKENFSVKFYSLTETEAEFDLVGGIEAPLVNAMRRLLLSDVPSMAIEKVYITNNTSIIQDEVLAHRLGLVPLRADPSLFEYRQVDEPAGATNCLQFELKVRCSRDGATGQVVNSSVYSGSLRFVPLPAQSIYTDADVGSIHDDILLAKLRPGHEIDLRVEAVKGVGRDHAKFSPVATAWYRILPVIRLNRRVFDDQARKLRSCFSPGVIELRPCSLDDEGSDSKPSGEHVEAVVVDARYDNCSRNVFRHEDLRGAVQLGRVKDHYIFTVESVGALAPDRLFVEAANILVRKCRKLLSVLDDVGRNKSSAKSKF